MARRKLLRNGMSIEREDPADVVYRHARVDGGTEVYMHVGISVCM